MANCTNCSAPLPPDSIQCDYCGTRNDIDLQGINYYTTHETDSERVCPRCAVSLSTIDLKIKGRFLIERCGQCLGLFFDPGELEALLEASVSNVFTIDNNKLNGLNAIKRAVEYGAFYIKCPVCSKLMNRVNFGTKSGVIVNRCREHGVWLDGGELRHLFEWMKAGGQLLDKERHEQALAEAAREKQRPAQAVNYTEQSVFDSYGSTLKNEDPDLFDLVRDAIRIFTR